MDVILEDSASFCYDAYVLRISGRSKKLRFLNGGACQNNDNLRGL